MIPKGKTNAVLTLQSDADRINDYLLGKEATLSTALQKKLERLQVVADLLRKYGSRMKVAPMLQRLWPDDCSRATAYRYIEEATDVFSPQQSLDRAFYVDVVLGMMFSTREKALTKGDLKTAAAAERNLVNVIVKFMGTGEKLPYDKIQPAHNILGFYPELTGKPLPKDWEKQMEAILKNRKVGIVADQADIEDAQVLPEEELPSE